MQRAVSRDDLAIVVEIQVPVVTGDCRDRLALNDLDLETVRQRRRTTADSMRKSCMRFCATASVCSWKSGSPVWMRPISRTCSLVRYDMPLTSTRCSVKIGV